MSHQSTILGAPTDPRTHALVLMCIQRGYYAFNQGSDRSSPDFENNVAMLLAAFRAHVGSLVIHVSHDNHDDPDSYVYVRGPGHPFERFATPDLGRGEGVIHKGHASPNGFHGTGLYNLLWGRGYRNIVLAGLTTDQEVQETATAAKDLGFGVTVALDATATWGDRELHLTPRAAFQAANRVLEDQGIVRKDASQIAAEVNATWAPWNL